MRRRFNFQPACVRFILSIARTEAPPNFCQARHGSCFFLCPSKCFADLFARVTKNRKNLSEIVTRSKLRNETLLSIKQCTKAEASARPQRRKDVKPPPTHYTKSLHRVILHIRRATRLVFQGAIRGTALCSAMNSFAASSQSISRETPPTLPTGASRPCVLFMTWPFVFSWKRNCPALFFSFNFHSKPVRFPTSLLPTYFVTFRKVLYMDSQSSCTTPSYNVWHSALSSESSSGRLHVFRSILVVSTKAF